MRTRLIGGMTIDGFISGAVSKKMGLTVDSVKSEAGERTYRIAWRLVEAVTPSCLAASARRWGRMDQDEEQVVWLPHDADLERIGTRGQIEWLSAGRDESSAGVDERRKRGVNVR